MSESDDNTREATSSPHDVSAFFLDVERKIGEIRAGAHACVLLGVAANAEAPEVRRQYRLLMKRFHPDTCAALIEASPTLEEDLEEIIRSLSAAKRVMCGATGPLAPPAGPGVDRSPGDARPGAAPPERAARTTSTLRQGHGPRRPVTQKTGGAFYAEGSSYLAARDWAGAAESFQRAIELEPEDGEFRRALGEALADAPGRELEALAALREAVRLEPASERAWYNLGEVAERAGRRSEARSAYARVLALDPGSLRARLAVARLDATAPGAAPGGSVWLDKIRRMGSK